MFLLFYPLTVLFNWYAIDAKRWNISLRGNNIKSLNNKVNLSVCSWTQVLKNTNFILFSRYCALISKYDCVRACVLMSLYCLFPVHQRIRDQRRESNMRIMLRHVRFRPCRECDSITNLICLLLLIII